jgi:hypothetical protein
MWACTNLLQAWSSHFRNRPGLRFFIFAATACDGRPAAARYTFDHGYFYTAFRQRNPETLRPGLDPHFDPSKLDAIQQLQPQRIKWEHDISPLRPQRADDADNSSVR